MKQKPIAVLEQFNHKDKKITYMVEFLGKRDYWGPTPEAIAFFYVYDKKKWTFWDRLLFSRKYKKMLGKRMIASQSIPINV